MAGSTEGTSPDFEQLLARHAAEIRGAAAHGKEDPYELGSAVRRFVADAALEKWLAHLGPREALKAVLPELDAGALLHAAVVAGLCTREDVATLSWAKLELLARLLDDGAVDRGEGALGDVLVPMPHQPAKRLAECTLPQLEAALASAQARRAPRPKAKAPEPAPPGPTPSEAPATLPLSAKAFIVALAIALVGTGFGGSWVGVAAQLAGIATMVALLWRAGAEGVAAWAAWARGREGVPGLLLGYASGLLARFRTGAIAALILGAAGLAGQLGWRLLTTRGAGFPPAEEVETASPLEPEPVPPPVVPAPSTRQVETAIPASAPLDSGSSAAAPPAFVSPREPAAVIAPSPPVPPAPAGTPIVAQPAVTASKPPPIRPAPVPASTKRKPLENAATPHANAEPPAAPAPRAPEPAAEQAPAAVPARQQTVKQVRDPDLERMEKSPDAEPNKLGL